MAARTPRLVGLALALALVGIGAWRLSRPQLPRSGPPHILFVLIDTLRPDHLGSYGYPRDTSPAIDAIAAEGVLFERAESVAPWTSPTVVSLFTGLYPQALIPPTLHENTFTQAVPGEIDTLAEVLRHNGYRTVGLVDHPGISPGLHYDQGFDTYVQLYRAGGFRSWELTDPDFVYAQVVEHLEGSNPDQPSFLYLHLVYPHRPYGAQPEYRRLFAPRHRVSRATQSVNRYDAEIRQTDALIGRIYRLLGERKRADSTWIVIASDHGEGFGEHGLREHGNSMYEELLRVPLIFRPPGGRSRPLRVGRRVSLVDVYPTLLALAAIPIPDPVDGESLVPLLEGGQVERQTPIFAVSPHTGDVSRAALFRGHLKYIKERDVDLLYDRAMASGSRASPRAGGRCWRRSRSRCGRGRRRRGSRRARPPH